MKRTWLGLAAAALGMLSGCTTAKEGYGGRPVDVPVKSDPPGATVYLALYNDWVRDGGDKLKDNKVWLEKHRVTDGVTPLVLQRIPQYEHVVVLERDGKRTAKVFKATKDTTVSVKLD